MVVAAVAAVAWAWLAPTPELEAGDAVEVATAALDAAGVDARIDPDPARGRYTTSASEDVDVWKVLAEVDGARISLWVAVDDGLPVLLDDRASGGDGQVLPDAAVRAISEHRANPVRDRRVTRNLLGTLAAVLLVVVAVQAAARAPRRRPRPT